MKISIRKIQLLNALLTLGYLPFYTTTTILITLQLYFLFLVFGVNIGLHRGFTHGNLNPDSFFGKVCLFFGTLSTLGRPSDWVLVHKLHHMYADQALDPHSPKHATRWRVFLNTWKIPKNIPRQKIVGIKKAVLGSKCIQFFDRYYYPTILIWILGLLLFGGFRALIFGWAAPATLCLLATSLVNAFCHDKEGRTYDNRLISLLTFGEGNHKEHHLRPMKLAYTSFWSFDVSGLIAKLFIGSLNGKSSRTFQTTE